MNGITAALRCTENEFRKILAQTKYRFIAGLAGVCVILGALIQMIPAATLQISMGNYPFTVLSVVSVLLLPIASFMMAADLFSGEEERNELKILFTRPVPRGSIVVGKICGMLLFLGGLLLLTMLLSAIASIISTGFGSFSLLSVAAAYALTIFPALFLCTMAAMISSVMKTGTAGFVVSLLAYLGIFALGLVFTGISPALPGAYMTIYKMIIGTTIPVQALSFGIAVLCGYSIIFFSGNLLMFDKKEV